MAQTTPAEGLDLSEITEAVRGIDDDLELLIGEIDKVGRVADQIDAIAKQTNLLALTTTIEAERGGAADQGFAVVAGEVKALSGQTGLATMEIGKLLQALNTQSQRLTDHGQAAREAIERIKNMAATETAPQPAAATSTPTLTLAEGPISQVQKELVQSTFSRIAPIALPVAELFYDKLFELDASLKPLFKGDMKTQAKKLMVTLMRAVKGLDDLDTLVPVVQSLGRRHAGYGVKDKDYDTFAEALLWSLKQVLEEGFTPEVKQAWAAVYSLLAETMIGAAAADTKGP